MRGQLLATSALSALLTLPAHAQAPASAGLWRIAATSLATPPPLEPGSAGFLWNPAAPAPDRAIGLDVIQTASAVGLSGLSVGGQTTAGQRAVIGLVFGRMQVRDLVRTTTSPNSEGGGIPVHEQFVGGKLGVRGDWFELATVLRYHDERFDALGEQGFTLDFGMHIAPSSMMRFAAATHFLPVDFSKDPTTDFFMAGEVEPLLHNVLRESHWRIMARYGVTLRPFLGPDHMMSTGMRYDELLSVDLSVTHESGFTSGAWRPAVSFSLRIGRYTIGAARGSGVNGVDGTYRVGLNIQLQ